MDSRRTDALVLLLAIGVAACADTPPPGAPSADASASASISAAPSASVAPVPPPERALFVVFDAEPTESPDGVKQLEDLSAQLTATGRVELTGSAVSTGDLTNDRSKALRRGEALRNWFIEHGVSGVKVVVKNPGPPCVAAAGEDAVKKCQGVQVDVWLR